MGVRLVVGGCCGYGVDAFVERWTVYSAQGRGSSSPKPLLSSCQETNVAAVVVKRELIVNAEVMIVIVKSITTDSALD